MTDPFVSIVIPAHNARAFVDETIASVLVLEYPRESMELIVVDDGSTDGTAAAVRRALDACPFRWTVIEQSNAGPSRARNVGWQAAEGQWIQFLDADDLLAPSKLRIQAAAAAIAGPDVAVVYSPWQRSAGAPGARRPVGQVCVPAIGDDQSVLHLLETANFIATGSQLNRRTWLEKLGGYNDDLRLIEDVELLLRIAMAGGRFVSAPADRPLFFYTQREGSLSKDSQIQFVDGCVRNALFAEDYWRQRQADLSAIQQARLTDIYGTALRVYIDADRRKYRTILRRLVAIDPCYRPGGRVLGILSRFVGCEAAESLAARYRRLRYGSGANRALSNTP